VQFNDGGAFGADTRLTYNKTTDQLTTYTLKLGIAGTATAIDLNTGNRLYWSDGSSIDSALGTQSFIASAGHGFSDTVHFQKAGAVDAAVINDVGARFHFSLGGSNDYFYSTGMPWATAAIRTPGVVIADGGFTGALTGNASTATALAANPGNCSAGQAALGIDASGAAEGCWTPSAGGGGNFVSVDVDFTATTSDMASTVVTGATWVTATSKIICSPTLLATASRGEGAEDVLLEGIEAAIHSRVAGTGFTLTAHAPSGANGIFTFHCTGG